MRALIICCALLALAGCQPAAEQAPANETANAADVGPVKGVDRSHKGKPAPDANFYDPDGGDISLADFKGVPVLVNLWASWCAPCIKELPTLQKLEEAQTLDGQLGVIGVSQDTASKASVDAFLQAKRISRFAAFHDPEMGLTSALGVEVMPTSVLYDANGRELWRYVGDLDWTSAEAARLLAEAKPGKP